MRKSRKGRGDRSESFDEFLEKDGLLADTEDAAIKEIIADQIKVTMDRGVDLFAEGRPAAIDVARRD